MENATIGLMNLIASFDVLQDFGKLRFQLSGELSHSTMRVAFLFSGNGDQFAALWKRSVVYCQRSSIGEMYTLVSFVGRLTARRGLS